MGFFWSIINPLIMVLLFTFFFSHFLRISPPPGVHSYALFVLSGILPWFAVQEALTRSASSILDNSSLVKTVKFPSVIFPLYLVISGIINEAIGIVLLLVFAVYWQGSIGLVFLLIIPVLALQALFSLGLGCIVATLQVYVRDTMQLLGVILLVWMYMTPIFYPADIIPPKYLFVLTFNPLYYLLSIYRSLLLRFELPRAQDLLVFSAISFLSFYVGLYVIRKRGRSLADLV